MSGLNPFTNQRKKREEKQEELHEKNRALQAGGQADMADAAAIPSSLQSFVLPSREVDYESEDFSKYLPASAQVEHSKPTYKLPQGDNYYQPPSRAWQCFSKLQCARTSPREPKPHPLVRAAPGCSEHWRGAAAHSARSARASRTARRPERSPRRHTPGPGS